MQLTEEQIKSLIAGNDLDIHGLTVSMKTDHDYCMKEPWREHDGHGVISELTNRSKRAGEKVLGKCGSQYYFYDIAGTIKKATEEGWGLSKEESEGLTPKQIIAKAVDKDFQRMKDWTDNKWHFAVIAVKVSFDGVKLSSWAVGGIESDYIEDSGDIVQDCLDEALPRAIEELTKKSASWAEIAEKVKGIEV